MSQWKRGEGGFWGGFGRAEVEVGLHVHVSVVHVCVGGGARRWWNGRDVGDGGVLFAGVCVECVKFRGGVDVDGAEVGEDDEVLRFQAEEKMEQGAESRSVEPSRRVDDEGGRGFSFPYGLIGTDEIVRAGEEVIQVVQGAVNRQGVSTHDLIPSRRLSQGVRMCKGRPQVNLLHSCQGDLAMRGV